MKYTNCILRKGKRVIQVLVYIAPSKETPLTPCGERRGHYACDVNGERRYIRTHNISRYIWKYHYTVEPAIDCYLHAQYASKTQENCSEKTEGLWNRFLKLIHFK